MWKNIKSRLTMVEVGCSFYDSISGDVVKEWVDSYGNRFLAVSRFGFRVKK